MDSTKSKPLQAPPNPPPPIPAQKRGGVTISPALIMDSDKKYDKVFQLPNNNSNRKIEATNNTTKSELNNNNNNNSMKNILNQNNNENGILNKVNLPSNISDKNSMNIGQKLAIPEMKLNGFVGFDSMPYQLVRKCQTNGFQYNVLCVGETGMGKTTLIESLFNMKVEFEPCSNELNTVELRTKTIEVSENNIHVKLRIVETAGFGDQLDKDKSAKVIVDYINDQFEAYLKEELKVKRSLAYYDDTRIHACLYFISPTGHGLKALDVVTMRELSKRVNVIPVIAKADTACKDELVRFKQKIIKELKENNIEIYQFPTDDETVRKENLALNSILPFAIIGSIDFVTKEDGRLVRARTYPWGIVEVENEEHCDFVKLREAMLRINQDSLRERTHILYERYRQQRLRELKMRDGDGASKGVTVMRTSEAFELRQKEFKEEILKCEEKLQQQFLERVNQSEDELKRREENLSNRQRQMEFQYKNELKEIESQINKLIEEKTHFENSRNNTLNMNKKRK